MKGNTSKGFLFSIFLFERSHANKKKLLCMHKFISLFSTNLKTLDELLQLVNFRVLNLEVNSRKSITTKDIKKGSMIKKSLRTALLW